MCHLCTLSTFGGSKPSFETQGTRQQRRLLSEKQMLIKVLPAPDLGIRSGTCLCCPLIAARALELRLGSRLILRQLRRPSPWLKWNLAMARRTHAPCLHYSLPPRSVSALSAYSHRFGASVGMFHILPRLQRAWKGKSLCLLSNLVSRIFGNVQATLANVDATIIGNTTVASA